MICVYCRNEIPDKSRFCINCKNYQSWWRNWLPYLGGFVAVIALTTSSCVYVDGKLQERRAKQTGDVAIRLVAARSNSEITLNNTGQRDIFVDCIIFELQGSKYLRSINRVVRGGEIITVKYEPRKTDADDWRCVVGEKAKLVREGRAAVKDQFYQWYTADHPELASHQPVDHAIFDGSADLMYQPFGETQHFKQTYPCQVIVVQLTDKKGEFSEELEQLVQETKFKMPVEGHEIAPELPMLPPNDTPPLPPPKNGAPLTVPKDTKPILREPTPAISPPLPPR